MNISWTYSRSITIDGYTVTLYYEWWLCKGRSFPIINWELTNLNGFHIPHLDTLELAYQKLMKELGI